MSTITMRQFIDCFANIAPDCAVTLVSCGEPYNKYHVRKNIYVDLSKPHTLSEWCSIFDGFEAVFDDVLVKCWAIKGFTKRPKLDPMINKMTILIKKSQ